MKITFEDKEQLITNPNIPRKNKVVADDVNEIKRAINDNDDSIEELDTRKADRTEIPTNLNQLSNADTKFVNETQMANAVHQETTARQQQDVELQNQIDAITSQSDVVDIVGTYAELQDYDTSTITENDIIKVLQDSTHENATSYFRWANNSWAYIGSEGPYYTKGETDERLNLKANQTSLDQTNENLNTLAGRVGTNETEISDIKAEQTTQNRQIATLIADSGNKIELSVNSQTYILTATLKNKAGEILNSSQVDLPLEAMIVNATYDSTTKELVLTLQNGTTLRVSLADIVSGLVSQDDFDDLEVRVDNLEDDVADIKDEQDTQNAEIEELQEQVEILENTVNSELEDGTATGESISVTDSANAPAKLLPIGRTEQNQYEGYNELETTMQYNRVTISGITATTNSDGTITLNGTANSATEFKFMLTEDVITLLENENYMLTRKLISGTASEILIAYRLDGITGTFTSESKNLGTSTSSRTIDNVRIYVNSGVTFNNARIGISLYKSSTEKSYEPFVGGQASPNPDYPQQIHVVKGHNEFLVQNKNWFNETLLASYLNGDYYEFTTLQIRATSFINLLKTIKFSENTQYTFSCRGYFTNGVYARIKFYYTDGTNNDIQFPQTNEGNISLTSLEGKTIDYIAIENQYYSNLKGTFIKKGTIQIEKGTTASSYVPHEENTAEFTLEEGQFMYEGDYLADDGIHHVDDVDLITAGKYNWTLRDDIQSEDFVVFRQIEYTTNKYVKLEKSNYFRVVTTTDNNSNNIRLINSAFYGIQITINKNIASTREELDSWLATHNLEIVYKRATERIEPYTQTQQAQYNKLKKVLSYYAGTNINTISAGDLAPILNFDYKKSNRLRIEALENAVFNQ